MAETLTLVRGQRCDVGDLAAGVATLWDQIEANEFGTCERCEEPISAKRLEARPETNFCIRCKEEQERQEKDYA